MAALSLLGEGEFWLYRAIWFIPPASKNSQLLRQVMWAIEELQKNLEDEVQISCQRIVSKDMEE